MKTFLEGLTIGERIELLEVVNKQRISLYNHRFLTSHPDDKHLQVIQGFHNIKNEYVVYLYNAEFKSLHEGNYYPLNSKDAEKHSLERFNTKR